MIDLQSNLMQKAFAEGRMDDARAHCKIFTELARERAKSFLMTAQAAQPGQCNPVHAGTPSPINGLDGRAGNERLRKQANNGSVAR